MPRLTRTEVRDYDRRAIDDFGMPGILLMENAARGAVDYLRQLAPDAVPIVVCCGKGNNGGDGFAMARHLDNHGYRVRIVLLADPAGLTGDAAIMFRIIERSRLPIEIATDPTVADAWLDSQLAFALNGWVVDALFGTGLRGPVSPPFDRVIAAINRAPAKKFAVDIPSGLDCDTGQATGPTVRADATATFVAEKVGFANPGAKPWLGQVRVIDIGAPRLVPIRANAEE
jgi:NAD(P)H-hydrate epimerase